MTSLLFVDDDQHVLSGLKRMLWSCRGQWKMDFCEGAEAALQHMARSACDVVITDMRMPGQDGAQLLQQVRQHWPCSVRIVLSGQSEAERIFRAIGPAHQYLSKPCDPERLKNTVFRATSLRDRLPNDQLKRIVSQLESVPSRPAILRQLQSELSQQDARLDVIASLLASDIGLAAKTLQLVSTSFFGRPQRVGSVEQAAALLGVDLLRSLFSATRMATLFDVADLAPFCLEELTEHSLAVAQGARRIAQLASDDPQMHGDAALAGLLHDIGKIVLASTLPDDYRQAVRLANERHCSLWQAETEIFGVSHAEVGSYLMGLWGLPDPITEAIAYYRRPHECPGHGFRPLTALHVANLLRRSHLTPPGDEEALLYASEYLREEGFADRVAQWRDALGPTPLLEVPSL